MELDYSAEYITNLFKSFVGDSVRRSHCPKFPIKDTILSVIKSAMEIFYKEGTLVRISGNFVLVGDLHGSLQDLLNIFYIFGLPPKTKYLFLGDYVDRGDFSVEVISYLLALKVCYPTCVYLIRGNHEFQHMNKVYGFYDEIIEKYNDESVWTAFNAVFSYLPLAVILNEKIFCVHGGLSPRISSIEDIESIQLPIVSYVGLPQVSDLVWSDPSDTSPGFVANDRGAGVIFGKSAIKSFLLSSNLSLLVRAHQSISTGVRGFAGALGVTIFSHSKYADESNMCGAAFVTDECNIIFYSIDGVNIINKAITALPDGCIGLQSYDPHGIKIRN
jgi:diadenosine tetraphosphatase ApaH/serine/threonine PP2A family protein phosphatase